MPESLSVPAIASCGPARPAIARDSILITPFSENGMPGEPARIDIPNHAVPVGIAFSADGKTAYVALSRANSLAIDRCRQPHHHQTDRCGHGAVWRGGVQGTRQDLCHQPRRPPSRAERRGSALQRLGGPHRSGHRLVRLRHAQRRRCRDAGGARGAGRTGALAADAEPRREARWWSPTATPTPSRSWTPRRWREPTSRFRPFPKRRWAASRSLRSSLPTARRSTWPAAATTPSRCVIAAGKTWKVAGAVPTAWFPSASPSAAKARLRVLNIKGVGNTANAKGTFNSKQYEGSLEMHSGSHAARRSPPARARCGPPTAPVYEPAGGIANLRSLGIEHVFLIVKENRTYDQVLRRHRQSQRRSQAGDVRPRHHAQPSRPGRAVRACSTTSTPAAPSASTATSG